MSSTSYSQYGILFVASIGTLMLMMAPQPGSALECYVANTYEMSRRGHGAALDLGHLLQAEAAAPHLLMFGMPTNGNDTMQCPTVYKYCLTARCPTKSDKTIKTCVGLLQPGDTPQKACAEVHKRCPQDPKFYIRVCQTDKCNDEPLNATDYAGTFC